MPYKRLITAAGFGLIGLLVFSLVSAQDQQCAEVVERALLQVNQSCVDLPRNSVCYGYNNVSATFADSAETPPFAVPGDQANLIDLQSIVTGELDVERDLWGVAVLNVQANIPNTLPGQVVTFLLLGDTEIENAVEQPVLPGAALTLTTTREAALRGLPEANANVIVRLAANTELDVDAISPDGEWLRTFARQRIAWIPLEAVDDAPEIADLPAISPQDQAPMQAIRLRTGLGESGCEQAPDALIVQGPQGYEAELVINGAEIRFGSTLVLQAPAAPDTDDATAEATAEGTAEPQPAPQLRVIVLEGQAVIDPDGDDPVTIEQGYGSVIEVQENGVVAEDPAPVSGEVLESFTVVEEVQGEVLGYEVEVATATPTDTPQPATRTAIAEATLTPSDTPEPSATPVPPPTSVPATSTPIPPTATLPPTFTPLPTFTSPPTLTPPPTNTTPPTLTSTITPFFTSTPLPATNTPGAFCGDATCNGIEDCITCPGDCGACTPTPTP